MDIKLLIENSWNKHRKLYKTMFFVIFVIFIIVSIVFGRIGKNSSVITFAQFSDLAKDGKIKQASILRASVLIETSDGNRLRMFILPMEQVKVIKVLVENNIKPNLVKA